MKILIVTQQRIPHTGGLSTHVEFLMSGLRGLGHRVELIQGGRTTPSKGSRLLRMATSLGNRDRYREKIMSAVIDRLGSLFRQQMEAFQPDVVHCHDVYASTAVAGALGERGIPFVDTVHGPALYEARMGLGDGYDCYYEFITRCEHRAFEVADRLIAVDSGQAGILTDDYGVDVGKIVVIYNCVDVELVRELATGGLDLSHVPDGPFFIVPRRLVEKTGVRYAIEAMQHVGHETHMVICGQGPLRSELETLAAQLGLAGRIHFLGPLSREKLMPLFAHSVAVIVPSVPASGVIEATSLAVTEAMAAGTVPVASGIGGLAELIDDGETGLLVPPADAQALGEALDRLVGDSGLRDQLVRDGTTKVETDYSTAAWLQRILDVYRQAGARE